MEQNVQMLSNRSNEVLSYWYSLRRGNKAPLRTQLDPTALRSRLPDLLMLGWQGLDLVFRLAGTRVCELFGKELRDQAFAGLWDAPSRDTMVEAVLSALRSELPVVCEVTALRDGDVVELELVLLPLRSPEGACDRLLGSLILPEGAHLTSFIDHGSLALHSWQPTQQTGFIPSVNAI